MICAFDASLMRPVLVATDFEVWECVASAHSVRVGADAPVRKGGMTGVAHDPLLTALRDHARYGAARRCHDCTRVVVPGETLCSKHRYANRQRRRRV